MTDMQLADEIMQLALAAQTLGYVLRMIASPIDVAAMELIDQAQAEVNDVMLMLARGDISRATAEGDD